MAAIFPVVNMLKVQISECVLTLDVLKAFIYIM